MEALLKSSGDPLEARQLIDIFAVDSSRIGLQAAYDNEPTFTNRQVLHLCLDMPSLCFVPDRTRCRMHPTHRHLGYTAELGIEVRFMECVMLSRQR